jgi:CheY-like chemotaxis protein
VTEAQDHRAPAADPPTQGRPASTVLYVEDNPSNLRLVEVLLARRPGVELLSATTAALGVDIARARSPDLVLLDLQLPDKPGDWVLTRLRDEPRTAEIPVVILSADATPGQLERLLAAGADDYLTKPIDATHFLDVVARHLRRDDAR